MLHNETLLKILLHDKRLDFSSHVAFDGRKGDKGICHPPCILSLLLVLASLQSK